MRLVPSRGLWGRSCHSRNLLALWFDLCTLSLMSVKSWIFLLKNQLDSNETAVFCKLTYRQDLKKCRNCTFKVIFLCQKSMQYARDHFLLNFFFLDLIFEPLYFLKLGPIFVGPTQCQFTKYSNFIWLLLIFVQKPCFLGPIKQETPWRNWH